MPDDEERSPGYVYLDLLVTALSEHEKNLSELIDRLGKVTEKLSNIIGSESIKPSVEKEPSSDEENEETLIRTARDILQGKG